MGRSEIRYDKLTGTPVLYAPDRAARPQEFAARAEQRASLSCPFCRGHEAQTPHGLAAYNESGSIAPEANDWLVRVVPNKYPVVLSHANAGEHEFSVEPAWFSSMPALGCHEVIIESPRHVASLGDLTSSELQLTFQAYRDRLLAAKATGTYATAHLFKNVGAEAGASLGHTHSQLVALPLTPPRLQTELHGAANYFSSQGTCLFCAMTANELRLGPRIVAESKQFVAFCPYASRFAYEVWLMPRSHEPRFEHTSSETLAEFATLAQSLVRGLEQTLQRCDYNYLIHSAPFDSQRYDHYHWHMELFPREGKLAGFELGTGCHINSVLPELAARRLRENMP